MSDPLESPEPQGDAHRTPNWVKVFGAIIILVVVLLLVLLLTRGSGGHGPQRHFSFVGDGGEAADWHLVAVPSDGGADHG